MKQFSDLYLYLYSRFKWSTLVFCKCLANYFKNLIKLYEEQESLSYEV